MHTKSSDKQPLTLTSTARPNVDRRQLLLGGLALVGSTGCGFLLHPERRGRTGGNIDGTVLIFDLLWLIPGLLPGIVCLAVDFTTGGIYGSGTSTTITVSSAPRPPLNGDNGAPSPSAELSVEVELDGAIVASGGLAPDMTARLDWRHAVEHAALRERGVVRVRGAEGRRAEADARDLLAATVPVSRST